MNILEKWYDKRITVLSILFMILILAAAGIYTVSFGTAAGSGGNRGQGNSVKYTVIIRHYGINPGEMERSITIPLEDRISGIYGIKEIRSVSELNTSRIEIALNPGIDVKEFYIELRDAVGTVYSALPSSVQKPEIFSSSGNNRPILIVSFDSENRNLNYVRDVVEGKIKPGLEKIEGTGEIEVGGGELTEIHVIVNRQKAQSIGLGIPEIGTLIRLNYVKEGLGFINSYGKRINLILTGRLSSIKDIKNLKLKTSSGKSVVLNSIAEVKYGKKEYDTISRVNGRKKVVLYIKSAGTGNPLKVSEMVKAVLAENFKTGNLKNNGTEDIFYQIIYDYGNRLKKALVKLIYSIIYAMLIVALFLLITLKNFRKVVLLALSIPLTAAVSVSVLGFFNVPVGISILSGLAIGIGLIADTGIIIVTAVSRAEKTIRTEQTSGRDRVTELIPSLAASSATTIIAVVPLFFIPESIQGIKNIALIFIILIIVSFIFNVFFLPPFIYSAFSRTPSRLKNVPGRRHKINRLLLKAFYFTEHFIVSKPAFGLIFAAALALLLGLSLVRIPREIHPGITEPVIFCHIEFDSGTNVKTIDSEIRALTDRLLKIDGIEKIEALARRDNGSFSVRYDPDKLTRKRAISIIEAYNNSLYNAFIYIPDTAVKGTSIEVGLIGPDDTRLREKGREAALKFMRQPWVDKTVLHYKKGPPEWVFTVDHTRLSGALLTTEQVVNSLRWQIYGPVSIKWMESGNANRREIDLRVMGVVRGSTEKPGNNPDTITKIMNTGVLNSKNKTVPLKEVGEFTLITGRARIYRLNRQRAVFFGIKSRINDVNALYDKIRKTFGSINLKAGYSYRIDPALLEIRREYVRLELLLILAVVLIFMLIASQYESLSAPVPVILSIPVSLSIPFIVMWAGGRVLTTSVFIGLIVVTGIVVNNTIILVDDILRRRDKSTEESAAPAILYSLRKRIVPMLLTSGSTLLGLMPLFLNRSASAGLVRSLAFVVFWGIFGSIITSMIVIPAVLAAFPVFTRRSFLKSSFLIHGSGASRRGIARAGILKRAIARPHSGLSKEIQREK
ncbi:MAG: efflux RND transporter permease subunit [Spirochaetes bacterium]|nr:efflux RND transporter permease subunit [Spirochaetota bacterium]